MEGYDVRQLMHMHSVHPLHYKETMSKILFDTCCMHTPVYPKVTCDKFYDMAVAKTYQIPIHCTCRTQEAGNMVECERCGEWYHQECARGGQGMFGKKEAFHGSADTALG